MDKKKEITLKDYQKAYSIETAAKALSVCTDNIRKLIKNGSLQIVTITPGKKVILEKDILSLLKRSYG
jgi:excisionase family DNA binding protein